MNPFRCALIVGHTSAAPGAVHPTRGVSEFAFNDALAPMVVEAVRCAASVLGRPEVEVVIVHRGRPNRYKELPAKVNQTGADIAIEMHANASAYRTGTGSEVLYWYASSRGRLLAGFLQRAFVQALSLRDRGLRPITQTGDRGGLLLAGTRMPCVIAEPFFIDRDEDLTTAEARRGDLARAYAAAIIQYAEAMR